MELMLSQKAELFDVILKSGTNPASLSLEVDRSVYSGEQIHVLRVKGSNFFFTFDNSSNGRRSEFSPASETARNLVSPNGWTHQLQYVSHWCKCLQRESTAQDPWENLGAQLVAAPKLADDARQGHQFTVPEYQQVDRTLEVIKALLVTYAERNETTIKQIQLEIGQLKEMAKTQDRKSFFQQVVGYIASTATSMGLDGDKTRALWEKLKEGLQGIVYLLQG